MNYIMLQGNLVSDVQTNTNGEGKTYTFGKIGVYNGKNKSGETRESMFFDFVVFGRDAEDLQATGTKGTPIIVAGRLEEDKSEKDGKIYVNKRVICTNAKAVIRVQRENTNSNYEVADPFAQ